MINTSTNTVVTAVLAGSNLSGIAVHPAGNRLYLTNAGANNVRVFDTTTNTFIATAPTVPESCTKPGRKFRGYSFCEARQVARVGTIEIEPA